MTNREMLHIVRSQLAIELNCTPDDLNGEKDAFVFTTAKDIQGRRPFPRNKHHFEMLTMGKAIVVTASDEILEIVKPQLFEKIREEAFSMPFVHGHAISYLPDLELSRQITLYEEYAYLLLERDEIRSLYQYNGFDNAIHYDMNNTRPDVLAIAAKHNGQIIGVAGASDDCEKMWQIGIDVLPQYRNRGLASYLVKRLTSEILKRGIVPYYCTSPSNLSSQRVAYRAGFFPAWLCSYKGNFDGYEVLPVN